MADDNRKKIHEAAKVCPVCGRQFWCYDVRRWAYREHTGKMRHICSWSCQAKHNAEQEEKRAKQKKNRRPSEIPNPAQAESRHLTARETMDAPNLIKSKKTKPGSTVPKRTETKSAKKKVEYHWIANLGQIMQAKGVSERDLEERAGIRRATIGQWRRADARCPDHKIDILADALGVSRAEFRLCDDRPDVEPVKREPKQKPTPKEWYWLVNLGAVMQEKGVSRRDLSIRSGIPSGTIAQWRSMRAKCQAYKLDILAEALGVTREAITERKTAPRDGSDHTMPESDGNTDDSLYHI